MERQIHASPGVYFRIIDYSSYSVILSSTNLGLVGTAKKGPTTPVQVSTINQFTNMFGTPRINDFSCFAALSYLEFSSSLWFSRVVGDNAKKARIDIPSARYIKDERLTTGKSFNRYIYKGTIKESPLANTVQVVIYEPDNALSYTTINADKDGYFYNADSSSILDIANNIDYDTGDYYFTLLNCLENSEIYVTYNDSARVVSEDVLFSIDDRAGKTAFTDNIITKYSNIAPETFQATVTSGRNSYLFVVSSSDTTSLTCEANASLSGTIDVKTGKCTFNLTAASAELSDDIKIVASYNFLRVYKKKLENYISTDVVNGQGYIGSIGTSIIPGTFKIYVGENVIAEDNGRTGKITEITHEEVLPITQFQTAVTVSTKEPIDEESLLVYISDTLVLEDTEGNGILTAVNDSGLNGTVKYNSKEIHIAHDDESVTFDVTEIKVKYDSNYINSCSNSVNADTGEIEFALVKPLPSNYVVDVNYMAKETYNIPIKTADTTVMGTVSKLPIAQNSVKIVRNGVVVLIDEPDLKGGQDTGYLTAQNNSGMNGVINYATGEFEITGANVFNATNLEFRYLTKLGTAEAKYYGESYDGIKFKFYNDIDLGLCLDIWNNTQSTSELPTSTYQNVVLDDVNSNRFIENKVADSELLEFKIDVRTDNLNTPLLQTILEITGGDSDEGTIGVDNAITALKQFEDVDTYDINLIACPDFAGDKNLISYLLNMSENIRGDCFAVVDPPNNLSPQQVVDWHNGNASFAEQNSINSSYGALYYPWIQIADNYSDSYIWVPPSVKVLSAYAYNDNVAFSWFAPAGLNRGQLYNVMKVKNRLTISERDLLYSTGTNCVNPICDFAGDGIVLYGQKTLQRKASALNRISVVRMLIYVTKILATATRYLVFEPNDPITWAKYRTLVTPVCEYVQNNRGLYEFKVICDETTNTSTEIDNNTMYAQVWLRPMSTSERIVSDFVITNTGADLNSTTVTSVDYSS